MDIYNVIKKPLITEKATMDRGESNRYYFKVDPYATKIDVRIAVEKLFNVNVAKVCTVTVHDKPRRNPRARKMVKGSIWKKAIVTLNKGEKIDLFEGV